MRVVYDVLSIGFKIWEVGGLGGRGEMICEILKGLRKERVY